MPSTRSINRAFREYYALLDAYAEKDAGTESTTENAMKRLLGDWCSMLGKWSLIKESIKTPRGNSIIPDGIIVDPMHIRRGYWEAKDTDDDLETEIDSKRRAGYPFEKNLLFDDTVTAVLFQDDTRRGDCRVRERECFERMLSDFFAWTSPPIQGFHQAMDRFTEDLPLFAKRLHELIDDAKSTNRKFSEQLERFFTMCRASLNPAVTPAQIEEMLAQHLLTERVARRVFRYDRFRETNAVARELENLVDAFLGDAPSRDRYMGGLDPYFKAVETYADLVNDFSEKQDFLTKVYEPFLNVYSPKDADRLGIVYTPQPIVRFIVNSVEAALGEHFGKSLADTGVHVLDPCTGTGNFIVAVMRKIHALRPSALEQKYTNELWANEILLLPYYIAGLNIETAYHELNGEHLAFPGACFTDTLLLNQVEAAPEFEIFSQKNAERVHAQEKAEITVILGNPPYNKAQEYENQGAKNPPHKAVYDRIRETYAKDSKATNLNSLYDPYIQFIRWATDRIGDSGIVCLVSNSGFLDDFATDGLRKQILQDFNSLYIVDLKGNIRKDSMRDGIPLGEKHTVFGLAAMVGVCIYVLVKDKKNPKGLNYAEVYFRATREEKFSYLENAKSIEGIKWIKPKVTQDGREWFAPDTDFDELTPLGNKEEKSKKPKEAESILHIYTLGVVTNRDDVVYNFDAWQLEQRVIKMIEAYNLEIDRWKRYITKEGIKKTTLRDTDAFIQHQIQSWQELYKDQPYPVNWSRDLKRDLTRERYTEFTNRNIRNSLYRPFNNQYLYFCPILNQDVFRLPTFFPTPETEEENRGICVSGVASNKPFHTLITNTIPCLDLLEKTQCFPLYVYDKDGSNRRLNVTPWGVKLFRTRYGLAGDFYDQKADADDPAFGPASPWNVFHYTYALLHAHGYREKYERNLKKSLPRIPLLGDAKVFARLAELGEGLAKAHLDYEAAEPYALERIEKPLKGAAFDWACPKLRLDSKDKTVVRYNDSLTLRGVPPEALEYRLGNRSAVEWVLDQHRKYPAKDDHVVRLLERVITVSLRTVEKVSEIDKIWAEHV